MQPRTLDHSVKRFLEQLQLRGVADSFAGVVDLLSSKCVLDRTASLCPQARRYGAPWKADGGVAVA